MPHEAETPAPIRKTRLGRSFRSFICFESWPHPCLRSRSNLLGELLGCGTKVIAHEVTREDLSCVTGAYSWGAAQPLSTVSNWQRLAHSARGYWWNYSTLLAILKHMNLSWFQKHSTALQGVAALSLILATAAGCLAWLYRTVGTDVAVISARDHSTIPPSLVVWVNQAHDLLRSTASATAASSSNGTEQHLKESLQGTPLGQRIAATGNIDQDIGALRLTLQNSSDHAVSGLRLRVDRLLGVWDITAAGNFLTSEEISKFLSHVEFSPSSREVVLPELPTIPERSSLYITIYGGTDFAEVAISGGSSKTKMKEIIPMEDTWLLGMYRNPWAAFGSYCDNVGARTIRCGHLSVARGTICPDESNRCG